MWQTFKDLILTFCKANNVQVLEKIYIVDNT